jgi:hypothetical protein
MLIAGKRKTIQFYRVGHIFQHPSRPSLMAHLIQTAAPVLQLNISLESRSIGQTEFSVHSCILHVLPAGKLNSSHWFGKTSHDNNIT